VTSSSSTPEAGSEISTAESELQRKFHKLATEYTKLRGKNILLKKAVVSDKSKIEKFIQDMEEKTALIDKQQSEISNLEFNSSRLRARCEKLQAYIKEHQGSAGKMQGSWMATLLMSGNNSSKEQELMKELEVSRQELKNHVMERYLLVFLFFVMIFLFD
jgi:protein phosphatase 1 regulatory subunit 21